VKFLNHSPDYTVWVVVVVVCLFVFCFLGGASNWYYVGEISGYQVDAYEGNYSGCTM
jgi:hypothetical protein